MFYNHTIGIIIPAFKVGEWISKVIKGIPDFVDYIIVVDDGSPDNTAQKVKKFESEKIRLLQHKKNMGVGAAMKTGFKEAIKLDIDLVVKMDGDDQMDPKYLVDLLYPLVKNECDYIKGNRFGILSDLTNMPKIRRLGSLILTLATKFASGYWHVVDSQNGYLAIKCSILKKINLEWIDDSYFFENSMLINVNIVEARVSDVLIPSRYGDEISSMSVFTIIRKFPLKLLRSLFTRLFYRYFFCDFSPVIVFLIIGILLMGGGVTWGLHSWYFALLYNAPVQIGTFAIGFIPILFGFQFCMNALILDIQQSPKGEKKLYEFTEKERNEILLHATGPDSTLTVN